MPFDGESYDRSRDQARLTSQLERVREILSDKQWHRLPDLKRTLNTTSSGVDARIRDLRKRRFGGYEIERKHLEEGVFAYRWTGLTKTPLPDISGSVMTVVLEIKDTERSLAVNRKLIDGGLLAGCRVMAVYEGNVTGQETRVR